MFTDRSKALLLLWIICVYVPCVSHAFASARAVLWPPAGKGLTSWLLLVMFIVFLLLSHVSPGSGVVLDYIVSRSLPPFLL